ncbi:DUF2627 family protein [Paenibacillus sp. 481]|uniref:DUF2627 family protein n=1 Tax=Paenibacillus sp. 481 TaxID=2835869 RepID=UPI001E3DE307|nr:DUF2627 family protein [Paenibacillus sp. 481]UHA72895.1 DUF2627 family protein [Paenibacillus sp. 481]
MKTTLSRFIAIIMLVIPGLAATYGFLLMKDSIYNYIVDSGNDKIVDPSFSWLLFLGGLVLFLLGAFFIGGWVFYRDKKRNYVASRFRTKKPRPAGPIIKRSASTTPTQNNE